MLDKSIEEILNEATLAAATMVPSSPGGSECSITDLSEVAQLVLEAEAEFHASATAAVCVHVRASSVGGTLEANWDSIDYTSFDIPCTAGSRVQITKPIWPDPIYLTVMVENEDATYAATNVKVTRVTQDIQPT